MWESQCHCYDLPSELKRATLESFDWTAPNMLGVRAPWLVLFTSVYSSPTAPLYFSWPWGLTWRKSSFVRICKAQGLAPAQDSAVDRSWWSPGPWHTPQTEQEAGSGRSGPSSLGGCDGISWSVWLPSAAKPGPCRKPWTNLWALEVRDGARIYIIFVLIHFFTLS